MQIQRHELVFFFAVLGTWGRVFGVDFQPPQIEEAPAVAPLYSAHVKAGLLPGVQLKSSPQLVPLERSSPDVRPIFISAEQLSGKNDVVAEARGKVELRKIGNTLTTDHLTYWQDKDLVEASGNVCLTQDDKIITGPKLQLQIENNIGFFEAPQYTLKHTA